MNTFQCFSLFFLFFVFFINYNYFNDWKVNFVYTLCNRGLNVFLLPLLLASKNVAKCKKYMKIVLFQYMNCLLAIRKSQFNVSILLSSWHMQTFKLITCDFLVLPLLLASKNVAKCKKYESRPISIYELFTCHKKVTI